MRSPLLLSLVLAAQPDHATPVRVADRFVDVGVALVLTFEDVDAALRGQRPRGAVHELAQACEQAFDAPSPVR